MHEPHAAGLRQALELFEVAEALVEQRLIREGVSPEARAERLRAWRLSRPAAPRGDGHGRSIDVQRFR